MNYTRASDSDPSWAAKLPLFAAEISLIFMTEEQLRTYFATTTRVGPAAHVATEQQYQTMRDAGTFDEDAVNGAADAILFERAQVPLLGGRARRRTAVKRRRPSGRPPSKAGTSREKLDCLDLLLTGDEALAILRELLSSHPELLPDARRAANALLATVSFTDIAMSVFDALVALDLDDLDEGPRPSGYVEPSEAAWAAIKKVVGAILPRPRAPGAAPT